eukprot:14354001-Alexandrium_andersonii.AAC.1
MSASLVGSEMCIRDSFKDGLVEARQHAELACALTASPCQRASVHTSLPVSYTHLTLPTICSV